ncbi:Hypothetical_protein [Hexamita inflata]|uniref:Hypothetical_protein n=1 Tax=Hexamita inflata TaxID=28002 RepID=A0ABP1JEH2_9EUKA
MIKKQAHNHIILSQVYFSSRHLKHVDEKLDENKYCSVEMENYFIRSLGGTRCSWQSLATLLEKRMGFTKQKLTQTITNTAHTDTIAEGLDSISWHLVCNTQQWNLLFPDLAYLTVTAVLQYDDA